MIADFPDLAACGDTEAIYPIDAVAQFAATARCREALVKSSGLLLVMVRPSCIV